VRNTLTAIQMQLHPSRGAKGSASDLDYDDSGADGQETISMGRSKRSGSITSWNSVGKDALTSTPGGSLTTGSGSQVASPSPGEQSSRNGSTTSVYESKLQNASATSVIYNRSWEIDMENLLKVLVVSRSKVPKLSQTLVPQDMYNAIKSQQILQPLSSSFGARPSTSSLSPGGTMLRNRSIRGQQPDRLMTLKRGSIRGLQSIMGAPTGPSPYSSNSSIDGRASPSPSFATSINEAIIVILQHMMCVCSNLIF
jgi:PH and SEC7 domain-containing protein